jgi:FKBP-type peptidyl-prolyl cis-trans isomerase (trigger factor)
MVKTKKAAPKPKSNFDAKITWLPNKTFELEFSIPWTEVKKTYDSSINQLVKTAKVSGFRQGKTPKSVVEKSVDKGKLYGEVINQLLPISYAKAISQHQLKPAVAPKVQIIKAEEDQSWEFKATSCELPEIVLGDYQKIVKGAIAQDKIWTPDKGLPAEVGKPDEKQPKPTETQKFNLIAKTLIDEVKIELPELLIATERDRLLSKLLDQINKLGLTIEQYATSNGKTVDQLKQEQAKTAENTLKIELILQAIADDKKFEAAEKDIQEMISQAGDEKLKEQLNTPQEKAYIASVLRKRQVIDYLIGL